MTEQAGDPLFSDHQRYDGSAVIIGAGSVGSLLAAKLAKAGFRRLYLLDHDVLELKNVPRHYLGTNDVGQPKAPALARRLGQEVASCVVEGEQLDFLALDEDEQIAYLSQARLVVAATDSVDCQLAINRLCVANHIPAIYPGIGIWPEEVVRHGEVGHILPVVPGEHTPCFQCFTGWRPGDDSGEEAVAGRGGAGLDIDYFAGIVAWAAISLFHPDDPHAEIFDPARPLTLVHSPSQISPAVRPFFTRGNIANLELLFPSTPCPVCGGRRAANRETQLVSPDIPNRTTSREMPPRRSPPGTASPHSEPLGESWLVGRAVWLLTIVAVCLISDRLFSLPHVSGWADFGLIALEVLWYIAVVGFGLILIFAGQSDSPLDTFDSSVVWVSAGLSVALLVVGIVLVALAGPSNPATAPSGGSQSAPSVNQPAPASTLPTTASTSFDVSPVFSATGVTVSGISGDAPGDNIPIKITPSLQGFELYVQISARYTAADINDLGISPVRDLSSNCLDVDTSENAQPTYEGPVSVNLSSFGGTVTGTMVYPAVLPGEYSFDLNCLGTSGQQSNTIDIGSITTGDIGVQPGTGDNDNSLVVFAENKSTTDTTLLYGAVGSTTDGSESHPVLGTCIITSPPQENSPTYQEASVNVHAHASGDGTWFEVGTMTFNIPASKLFSPLFWYDCSNTNGGGLPLP